MANVCKHGRLETKCELCQAAIDIKAAYAEGFAKGFEAAVCQNGDDPFSAHHWPLSDAKRDHDCI